MAVLYNNTSTYYSTDAQARIQTNTEYTIPFETQATEIPIFQTSNFTITGGSTISDVISNMRSDIVNGNFEGIVIGASETYYEYNTVLYGNTSNIQLPTNIGDSVSGTLDNINKIIANMINNAQ